MNLNDANSSREEVVASPRTAIYLRACGAQMSDGQESELRQFCLARGWSDIEVFMDRAAGGKSSLPALDKLMQGLRDGLVCRVVCHSLQALGRSLTNLCLVVEEMNRLNVPFLCVSQDLDTSLADCAKALAAVCQFRRGLYREKVCSGLASAKARGTRLGRPATLDRRREEVLELKGQGLGVRAIARELTMPVASVFKLMKEAAAI